MNIFKETYLSWLRVSSHIPRGPRYTIGNRIENKLIDLLEFSYEAYFSGRENKVEKIDKCIFVLDAVKYLITVAWEGRLISNNNYEELAGKLDEAGRMFGGWKNSFKNPEKKNRTL